jgi:hypothetical protein
MIISKVFHPTLKKILSSPFKLKYLNQKYFSPTLKKNIIFFYKHNIYINIYLLFFIGSQVNLINLINEIEFTRSIGSLAFTYLRPCQDPGQPESGNHGKIKGRWS